MDSENEKLLQFAREERAQLLKEARETKDRIINEAKEQAKFEANKIIIEAQAAINRSKEDALNEVEEAKNNTLSREIEFPPELVEAGLSLLNHFSTIINSKYAGTEIKIRIEQKGNKIRFNITTPTGELLEMVEEDLAGFGKVIKGEMPIESLISDPLLIIKFRQRIELLSLELTMTKQITEDAKRSVEKLEQEKEKLYALIGQSFSHLSSSQDTISELMAESREHRQVYLYLQQIHLELAKSVIDEQILMLNLEKLKSESPKKASKAGEYIINFLSSTASGLLVEWIKQKIFTP